MTTESESTGTATVARPGLVWVTFVLFMLLAVVGLGGALLSVLAARHSTPSADGPSNVTIVVVAVVAVVVSLLNLLIATFVLRRADWARLLGIGLCALNLVGAVLVFTSGLGTPNCLGTAIQVALLVLLTRRSVAEWCF